MLKLIFFSLVFLFFSPLLAQPELEFSSGVYFANQEIQNYSWANDINPNFISTMSVKDVFPNGFLLKAELNFLEGGSRITSDVANSNTSFRQLGLAPKIGYELIQDKFITSLEFGFNLGANFYQSPHSIFEISPVPDFPDMRDDTLCEGVFDYKLIEYSVLTSLAFGYKIDWWIISNAYLRFSYIKGLTPFYEQQLLNGSYLQIKNEGLAVSAGLSHSF